MAQPATISPTVSDDTARRQDLAARFDGRAPRYTSYPTAVQFTPAVDAPTYRGWLAALPPAEAVSLYVHVPLCARLCWYCGCNTRAVNRREPVSRYVEDLALELGLLETALPGKLRARALHLGGGTPNMLSPDDLARLFAALRHAFEFSPDIEVAAELDPAVLTRDWVVAAAQHGLNRASLGVQDLSPIVQAAVNRIEPFEVIERAVGWLREVGVLSINLDLMYGLPRQTTADVLNTLRQVLTLRPERLALFGYAHVPWMKSHQQLIEDAALPGPVERLDQSEAAADFLASEGYVRIGLDHYALPSDEMAIAQAAGRLHRNFQGYTTDAAGTLIGIGASSIGRLPQGFVQNQTAELSWRKALEAGDLPIARGVALTPDDHFRGEIIERLMCDLTVDLAAICARHGRQTGDLAGAVASLAPLAAEGLVRMTPTGLTVTQAGRPVLRSVCAAFDSYLDPSAQRHSKAI
ncbi:oxygen-independent coproporphyrinogen III oxidase [Caulobacter sp. NIBR1757]|uniref:oxygen-independent coproporphyrinogen III oxidase n=1 Tax=Caulobacter sp. NIBR1757 TaxID=3016000 RepID=UPI0022EFF02F|nr:oxygen-independent coproporphyrinogen III oxidase [Caulobacter sp. NIBR1757]WGM38338.1 Oxygen-independent coproporphyrinogen III oxidase [Caulobacter sp. NIBR1757]